MTMKSSSLSKPLVSLFFLLLRKFAGRRHHRATRMAVTMKPSPPPPPLDMLHGQTLVVDVEAWILQPPVSAFPYFMLVAVEAGGFLRGLLLLLLYPLMFLLPGDGARARAMATVALVGLEEKEVARVGRAVLPKFFLEATAAEGVAAVQAAARVVAVSATFPRVMVDGFLKEYVGVDAVVGPEVRSVGGVLAGLMDEEDAAEMAAKTLRALFGDELEVAGKKGAVGLVGPASSGNFRCERGRHAGMATAAAGQVPEAPRLPRRPPRLRAHAAGRARHVHLPPVRHRARRLPHHRLLLPPVPRLLPRWRVHRHALPPRGRPRAHRAPRRRRRRRRATVRVQPPHAAGPHHRGRGAGEAGDRGDVQPEPGVGADRADPHGTPDAGPREGPAQHGGGAGERRPGGVPRGDHVPGGVPTPAQPAFRRARRRREPRGAGHPRRHVLRHVHQAGGQVDGPFLLHDEPAAGLLRGVPAARRHNAGGQRRPRRQHRRGEPGAARARRGAGVRAHRADPEGQVHDARRQRRRRADRAQKALT
ncbi:uncharacterized protein [Miscanthus floridulus]|uniref:uncharacterized protein isoform X2 n=1 Tax=Miscanthus floridulus TaxID=154761 RepID=UPI0034588692